MSGEIKVEPFDDNLIEKKAELSPERLKHYSEIG